MCIKVLFAAFRLDLIHEGDKYVSKTGERWDQWLQSNPWSSKCLQINHLMIQTCIASNHKR